MEDANIKIINAAEHLLFSIHKGQQRKVYNLCINNVLWKYNHNCSVGTMSENIIASLNTLIAPSDDLKFKHINYYLYRLPHNTMIMTGIYYIYKSQNEHEKFLFDYTIIFSDGLACCVQISGNDIPTKIYRIFSITEAVYNMQEKEILYIEAMRDHVFWHCRNMTIESRDSLKNVEAHITENFVRIHRSYLINKALVRNIQRCSVTMENGDIIPIPYKKYVNIKNRLLEK